VIVSLAAGFVLKGIYDANFNLQSASPAQAEIVSACKVLAFYSSKSNDLSEVLTYKNAFDFLKKNVADGNSIQGESSYFSIF
jgi:hypothetical protein